MDGKRRRQKRRWTLATVVVLAQLTLGCGIHAAPGLGPATPAVLHDIEPTSDDASRALPFDGVRNGRDLGGLVGANGTVPKDHFLRTANLSRATESDKKVLLEHGVNVDIDLRTVWEVMRYPDALSRDPRFHYVHISLMGMGVLDALYPYERGELYVHALSAHQSKFREVFQQLAKEREGAVLFHCASGKDRTGLIAAMLLDLAGVRRADIVHNYTISARYLYPHAQGAQLEAAILESPPAAIEQFLTALDTRYGGAGAYLRKVGVSDEDIRFLKTRLGQP